MLDKNCRQKCPKIDECEGNPCIYDNQYLPLPPRYPTALHIWKSKTPPNGQECQTSSQGGNSLKPFTYPGGGRMCRDGQVRASIWGSKILNGEMDPEKLDDMARMARQAIWKEAQTLGKET